MLNACLADDVLRSELAVSGVATPTAEAKAWLRDRREACYGHVGPVPLSELKGWHFAHRPLRLVHDSGRFFAVEGYSVRVSRLGETSRFDQPLINQPEIGILGFLAKRFDGVLHFLTQAKMEPGNVNRIQLTPTVQATKSNYGRVHRGRLPPYLEHFIDPGRSRILVDELQPEQGAYFVGKRNRNVVAETDQEVPLREDFRWLTLGQLRAFLRADHAASMDARSVLSCLPLPHHDTPGRAARDAGAGAFAHRLARSGRPGARAERSQEALCAWLEDLRAKSAVMLTPRSLDALAGWKLDRDRLAATGRDGFSVVGVAVAATAREVERWHQPLLEREGEGLLGLLCQERAGTLHLLMHAMVEPGSGRIVQLAPTVVCHGEWSRPGGGPSPVPPFADWFQELDGDHVRFTALQSEEGGRFLHFVYRYVVTEAPASEQLAARPDYAWMTLDQLAWFRSNGDVSIEARNLLACLGTGADLGPAVTSR